MVLLQTVTILNLKNKKAFTRFLLFWPKNGKKIRVEFILEEEPTNSNNTITMATISKTKFNPDCRTIVSFKSFLERKLDGNQINTIKTAAQQAEDTRIIRDDAAIEAVVKEVQHWKRENREIPINQIFVQGKYVLVCVCVCLVLCVCVCGCVCCECS